MLKGLVALWNRLPFAGRLLTTASCALLVAGAAMLVFSTRQEARDSITDLEIELAGELDTLPAALAETVVIGDFSTLQQTLDRYVGRPRVAAIEFHDTTGVVLTSRAADERLEAPRWFVSWLGFADLSGAATVEVGNHRYGELVLTLTSRGLANRSWERLLGHLAILLLAIGIDFAGIWLVLRSGLVPLKHLVRATDALAGGQLDTRLKVFGSPELRHVMEAFNRMAGAIQTANRDLRRANNELRHFADISAHHLQEPARRLAIFAQRLSKTLHDSQRDEDARAWLQFIRQESQQLRDMVRDIQVYLAVDQPGGPVQALDTAAVLADVLAHRTKKLQGAGVAPRVGALPWVRLERSRLEDVLGELIDNALRYRRSSGPLDIEVTGENRGQTALLRVADNGIGIDPRYRERVFRIFERLDPGLEDKGTGIGLSLVRRIAEVNGGRCWLEETPGGGTTVLIELPAGVAR